MTSFPLASRSRVTAVTLCASLVTVPVSAQQAGTHVVVEPAAGAVTAIAGKAIAFSAAASTPGSAGRPLTYQWNFGDGTTASGPTAQHSFGAAGTFDVALVVTEAGRGTGVHWTVTVRPGMAAAAGVAPRPASAPLAAAAMARGVPTAVIKGPVGVAVDSLATFDGTGSTSVPLGRALTYEWDFGDGTKGSGATAAHRFKTSGEFMVTLIAIDGTFRSPPVTRAIRVAVPKPGANHP